MLAWLFALMALSASAAIYKYVDKNGEVHYTDKPVSGAERMNLPQIQSYSPADLAPVEIPESSPPAKTAAAYRSISLDRPRPGETFRSAERTVTLSVRTDPALRPRDRIMFYVDGAPALQAPSRANALVVRIDARGTHHATAAVIGPDGKELARSQPVEFYMKPPVAHNAD